MDHADPPAEDEAPADPPAEDEATAEEDGEVFTKLEEELGAAGEDAEGPVVPVWVEAPAFVEDEEELIALEEEEDAPA